MNDLMYTRHVIEQLAYEEIRLYLSQQFLSDPVKFVTRYGKRPEDFNGADLRGVYKKALADGIQVRSTSPAMFKKRFLEGSMFGESTVRYNVN